MLGSPGSHGAIGVAIPLAAHGLRCAQRPVRAKNATQSRTRSMLRRFDPALRGELSWDKASTTRPPVRSCTHHRPICRRAWQWTPPLRAHWERRRIGRARSPECLRSCYGPATTPLSMSRPISPDERPATSARTSSVCCPSWGAGAACCLGQAPNVAGLPGTG